MKPFCMDNKDILRQIKIIITKTKYRKGKRKETKLSQKN